MSRPIGWTVGTIAAACCLATAPLLGAIETTYGEDPVPNTMRIKGFLNLGYGADPVPAKTPSQRWHEWRASRRTVPGIKTVPGTTTVPVPETNTYYRAGDSSAAPERGKYLAVPEATARASKKHPLTQYSHERLSGRSR